MIISKRDNISPCITLNGEEMECDSTDTLDVLVYANQETGNRMEQIKSACVRKNSERSHLSKIETIPVLENDLVLCISKSKCRKQNRCVQDVAVSKNATHTLDEPCPERWSIEEDTSAELLATVKKKKLLYFGHVMRNRKDPLLRIIIHQWKEEVEERSNLVAEEATPARAQSPFSERLPAMLIANLHQKKYLLEKLFSNEIL